MAVAVEYFLLMFLHSIAITSLFSKRIATKKSAVNKDQRKRPLLLKQPNRCRQDGCSPKIERRLLMAFRVRFSPQLEKERRHRAQNSFGAMHLGMTAWAKGDLEREL